MSRESSSSSEAGRLQALVSPSSLLFYTNDAVSHKQLLTIYNPHDFGINFKVYSTAPNKYAVIEPTGTIDGKKCIDINVRHKEPWVENEGKVDKFRISLSATREGQVVTGRKDVNASLMPHKRNNGNNGGGNHGNGPTAFTRGASFDNSTASWIYQHRRNPSSAGGGDFGEMTRDDLSRMQHAESVSHYALSTVYTSNPSNSVWLLAAIGVVCLGLLFMPTRVDCPGQAPVGNVAPDHSSESNSLITFILQWLPRSLEVSHACQVIAAYILGLISLAILR